MTKAVADWRAHAQTPLLAEKFATVDLHRFFVPFPSLVPVEHLYPYKPDWGRLLFAATGRDLG